MVSKWPRICLGTLQDLAQTPRRKKDTSEKGATRTQKSGQNGAAMVLCITPQKDSKHSAGVFQSSFEGFVVLLAVYLFVMELPQERPEPSSTMKTLF